MVRIAIVMLIGGGAIIYYGYQEHAVSKDASPEAVVVELADLEKKGEAPNNHLKIGKHVALWPLYVCRVEVATGQDPQNAPPSAKVDYAYCAIISKDHPWWQAYQSTSETGEDVQLPAIDPLLVLVKTKKYKTVGAIPGEIQEPDSVQGLVVNRIESLKDDEKKFIRESFPSVNFDKLLLLEEGRTPSSTGTPFAIMGGGVLLMLVAGGLLVARRKR